MKPETPKEPEKTRVEGKKEVKAKEKLIATRNVFQAVASLIPSDRWVYHFVLDPSALFFRK